MKVTNSNVYSVVYVIPFFINITLFLKLGCFLCCSAGPRSIIQIEGAKTF